MFMILTLIRLLVLSMRSNLILKVPSKGRLHGDTWIWHMKRCIGPIHPTSPLNELLVGLSQQVEEVNHWHVLLKYHLQRH